MADGADELGPVRRQIIAIGAGEQVLHPAVAHHRLKLLLGVGERRLRGLQLLLEGRNLLDELHDRPDINHRELRLTYRA